MTYILCYTLIICAKMNTVVLFRKTTFLSIILFICLVQSTQSNPLDVLRFVCDIRDGQSEDVTINTLPEYCTAVASSQNDEDIVKKMSAIKNTTMPFLHYFNDFSYEDWDGHLSDVQPFIMAMEDSGVNGIIFDNLYRDPHFDVAKNRDIQTFFQNLKQAKPDGLFGLALPKNADILPHAFDYSCLDEVIDFYVIQTIDYQPCLFDHVMQKTCTVREMTESLNALRESISLDKVLLTIQVYSIGISSNLSMTKHGPVILSYSDMCHYKGKKFSKHRKFCKDSLKSLFKKGRLVSDFGMLGAFIQFIDDDDFAGCCECKNVNAENKFPGTAAIVAGMDPNGEKPEPCENFENYKEKSASSSSSEQDTEE